MIPFGISVCAFLLGLIAHRASAPRRALRGARREIRRTTQSIRPVARPLDQALEKLRRTALPFIRRQKKQDFEEAPLTSLRDVGVSHVRWSALEEAGITTLGDLSGWTKRRLTAIDGIGEKSATEILEGAKAMWAQIEAEAPRPPSPDLTTKGKLTEKGGVEIARHALFALRALTALGQIEAIESERDQLLTTRKGIAKQSSFARWTFSAFRASHREEWIDQAEELAKEATALAKSPEFRAVERASREFAKERPERDDKVVSRLYGESFAGCVAVFEHALRGQSGPLASALSPELLARIEDQPLRLEGLDFTLRGYQHFGARFILAQGRTLLGDEMGLGKTVQALAAAVTLSHQIAGARILVVMPASLLHQWAREVRTRTPLTVGVAHGSQKKGAVGRWIDGGGVLAVSYATLRSLDLAARLEAADAGIDLAIADEAHYVKNPEAKRTQALTALFDRSERRCLMTGTPLENHPDEFQRILTLLDTGLESRTERGRHDHESRFLDPALFQKRVAEVYLRRTQKDVLTELPPRIEQDEWVELGEKERLAYEAAVREGNFMAMRQRTAIGAKDSAKLERLEECIAEHRAEGRKVIVFSYFLDVLERCAKRVKPVGQIDGRLSPAERDRLLTAFQAAPDGAVLLGQIVAAGVGLNLQCASAVIIMEPQLKPALEAQAIARAHRMGQTRRILVHRILADDTIDMHLKDRLAMKEDLFERYAEGSLLEAASGAGTEFVETGPEEKATTAEPTGSLTAELIALERAKLEG